MLIILPTKKTSLAKNYSNCGSKADLRKFSCRKLQNILRSFFTYKVALKYEFWRIFSEHIFLILFCQKWFVWLQIIVSWHLNTNSKEFFQSLFFLFCFVRSDLFDYRSSLAVTWLAFKKYGFTLGTVHLHVINSLVSRPQKSSPSPPSSPPPLICY